MVGGAARSSRSASRASARRTPSDTGESPGSDGDDQASGGSTLWASALGGEPVADSDDGEYVAATDAGGEEEPSDELEDPDEAVSEDEHDVEVVDDDDEDDEDYEVEEDMPYEVDDGEIAFVDEDGEEEGGEEDEEEGDDDGEMGLGATFLEQTGDDASMETEQVFRQLGIEELRQLLTYGLVTLESHQTGDDEEEEEEEEEGLSSWLRRGTSGKPEDLWEPIKEPVRAGAELEYGGEFGRVPKRPKGAPESAFVQSKSIADTIEQRKLGRRAWPKTELDALIPNTNGVVVAQYPAPCYSGQYSEDSSFFYTCTRDMRVHIYDTTMAPRRDVLEVEDDTIPYRLRRHMLPEYLEQATSLNPIQTIEARYGQWTITDANLSPDNQWMIYSSITPYVGLSPVRPIYGGDEAHANQVTLDFSRGSSDNFGIWSLRFSGDSREIIAGAHYGSIYVYDIESQQRMLAVSGHDDDVNGVAFADAASSHVFISGSDDSYLKVWDRRSLNSRKASGTLPGHTEGVTYIAPKGDGRYCISNSKDQSVRLWDLRMMRSSSDVSRWSHLDYGLRNWDYRYMPYRAPRYYAHPEDCSVMTYRGHSVLRTLIRCHFSPASTTGQRYIYSGSADGRIHVRVQEQRQGRLTADLVARRAARPGARPDQDPLVVHRRGPRRSEPVGARSPRGRRRGAAAPPVAWPLLGQRAVHAAHCARRELALGRAVADERLLGRPGRQRRKYVRPAQKQPTDPAGIAQHVRGASPDACSPAGMERARQVALAARRGRTRRGRGAGTIAGTGPICVDMREIMKFPTSPPTTMLLQQGAKRMLGTSAWAGAMGRVGVRRALCASAPAARPAEGDGRPSAADSPSTTHFGYRTVDEDAKEGLVGDVFSSVASSYDLMNDAMSLGIHRLWKNHFVEMLNPRGGIRCLDVAGGTGDIALRILDHARTKHLDRETSVTVLDINDKMLVEGQKRLKATMYWNTPQVRFQLGNAEALDRVLPVPERRNPPASTKRNPILPPLVSEPVPSESVDLYTIAFGIRNCTHIDRVIAEAFRVLKPGGIFACLEFGKVSLPVLAQLYRQYSFNVLPPLGHMLVGDRDSYQYLVESIERFPPQAEFAQMVSDAGFLLPGTPEANSMGLPRLANGRGAWEDLSLGIAAIWTGYVLATGRVRVHLLTMAGSSHSPSASIATASLHCDRSSRTGSFRSGCRSSQGRAAGCRRNRATARSVCAPTAAHARCHTRAPALRTCMVWNRSRAAR